MVNKHENDMDIIYKKYYKDVLCFARALSGNNDIAQEITQNTFYKAIKAAYRFRGDCDIRVWLCQIAKNDYLNYIRKEKRMVSNDRIEDMLLNTPDYVKPVLDDIEDAESAREIRLILDKMEEPYKEVFILRVLHEMPYSRIAEIYHKTENWARVTYYRAKMKICDALEEMDKTDDRKKRRGGQL